MTAKILLIDHNDSFTFNLVQLLEEAGVDQVDVRPVLELNRWSEMQLGQYDGIILSAGPGLPEDYPAVFKLLQANRDRKSCIPVLGICLGLQTIVRFFGGHLLNLVAIQHGRQVEILQQKPCPLLTGIRFPMKAGLYHSWAMDEAQPIPELVITAKALLPIIGGEMRAEKPAGKQTELEQTAHVVMALRHRTLPIFGVQFHPESYMTPDGGRLIQNWLALLG